MARMGEGRVAYRALVGKPEGRRPLGRPRLDGRIILKWVFESLGGGVKFTGFEVRTVGLVVRCVVLESPGFEFTVK